MRRNNDLTSAAEVFSLAIAGIDALQNWVGDEFVKAVELISKTVSKKGRVILSGMGKSGHIARKIAATFASTGTAAHFVHPGEASHGDLGMITENDVVILLSNSGETVELRDIINYCNRFSIPIVAIVRRKTSQLVSSATVALILPEISEANSINAPTTSTTMMLVLGDAIAVALLHRHNFGKEDFGVFHPGGKIGSGFIKVKDLMHKGDELPTVFENTKVSDVLIEMTSKRFGCVAVVSNTNRLLGIITDGDLRRHMSDSILSKVASEIMTKNPVLVAKDDLVSKALSIMEKKNITSLFIANTNNDVEGIIHIHDILRAKVT